MKSNRSFVRRGVVTVLGVSSTLALASIAWVGHVEAGYKGTYLVGIDAAGRHAWGGLGSARNSQDGTQQISCSAMASGLSHSVGCFAVNSAGESASCSVSDSSESEGIDLAGLTIMNESAYIDFAWDAQGYCTSITVTDYSPLEPKKP